MAEIIPTVMGVCPVPKCDRGRKHDHAMCLNHWRRVPKALQTRIWATAGKDWTAWQDALNEAVAAVVVKQPEQSGGAQA